MTPVQIKILLLKKGLSIQKIADELGTRRDMVSQMIHGHYYYPSLAKQLRRFGIHIQRPKVLRSQQRRAA